MDLLSSTNINKAELYRAIGYAKSTSTISVSCAACHSCPYYKSMASHGHTSSAAKIIYNTHCNSCSKKDCYDAALSAAKTEYHNEKNKYGIGRPDFKLSKLSIKLFILYHFIPSLDKDSGLIPNVNMLDVADFLGCSSTAIKNCNRMLLEGDYISYDSDMSSGSTTYDIIIKHYKAAFKPAKEGGRGYISIAANVFHSLKQIDNINSLRISLRALIDALSAPKEIQTAGNIRIIDMQVNDIRKILPKYCKPNVIRKCLERVKNAVSGIFDSFSVDTALSGKSTLSFRCNDATISAHCQFKRQLDSLVPVYQNFVKSFADDYSYLTFNAKSFSYSHLKNRDFFEPDMTEDYIKTHIKSATLFPLNNEWKTAFLHTVYTYGINIVRDALRLFFKTYYLTGRKYNVHNPEGLMAKLIKNVTASAST